MTGQGLVEEEQPGMAHIGETELDAGALARALWRKAWLLVLVPVLVAVATYLALGRVESLYTADTSILIEERESPLTRESGPTPPSEFDESAIQSQVEVLRSREIADAVIDRLDLTRRPEMDPARKPSLIDSVRAMLGAAEQPADTTIRQRVMDTYFERLAVYPITKSRVIGVDFVASDPQLAADVANAVADAFVKLQQDAKRESAVAATAWLEQEIDRLRDRVAEAEQAVADYRATHDLFAGGQAGNLSTQQLGEINAELARARAARAEAEARAQSIQSLLAEGGAIDSSAEVLDSVLIQRLRERQVALQTEIAELSTTLLPGHPRIRSLSGQLANLDAQIREETQKIRASLQTAARVAAAREESLMASLEAAKTDVSMSNEQEIELRALEREANAQRDLLESFLGRYREAVARTDANYLPADARIISRAVPPSEPSYPKKTLMSVAAALAALLVLTAILLLREFTSGRAFRLVDYGAPAAVAVAASPPPEPGGGIAVRDPEVEPEFNFAARAETVEHPQPEVRPDRLPDPAPAHAQALLADATTPDDEADEPAAADVLPTSGAEGGDRPGTAEIAAMVADPSVRLALFAGAEGGEGAGDIAFAVARRAAKEGLRLILIDVGVTPSSVLGGDEAPGLGELLAGDAAFGDVIRRDELARVHVIPMGGSDQNPPLQRLQLAIGALTHTYDKVIVVADSLDDWPAEHVRPDLAALVCAPDTTERLRTQIYETALERGAKSALIVRWASEHDESDGRPESEAA
jgi:exopolysaccharide transport family protein